MSTRCFIGKQNKDNTITYIYCHHDGYITKGVGETLITHYQNESQITKLLNLGDMSSLGVEPIDNPELWDVTYFMTHYEMGKLHCCTYKGNGEDGTDAHIIPSLDDYFQVFERSDCDYAYLWVDGTWMYLHCGALHPIIL